MDIIKHKLILMIFKKKWILYIYNYKINHKASLIKFIIKKLKILIILILILKNFDIFIIIYQQFYVLNNNIFKI